MKKVIKRVSKYYKCSICGRRGLKLWTPDNSNGFLICADCAEKVQSSVLVQEVMWEKDYGQFCHVVFDDDVFHRVGTYTGNIFTLPKWTVDENGQVPSYLGPGPFGKPRPKDDYLIIFSVQLKMFPASPAKRTPINPDDPNYAEIYEWWKKMPTR